MVTYEANGAEIAARVVDGEAVIINLNNGLYYSLSGSGAVLWDAIVHRGDVHEVAAAVAARTGQDADNVSGAFVRVAGSLEAEGLIRSSTSAPNDYPLPDWMPSQYEPPLFEKFDDMNDLLALDPPLPALDEE